MKPPDGGCCGEWFRMTGEGGPAVSRRDSGRGATAPGTGVMEGVGLRE